MSAVFACSVHSAIHPNPNRDKIHLPLLFYRGQIFSEQQQEVARQRNVNMAPDDFELPSVKKEEYGNVHSHILSQEIISDNEVSLCYVARWGFYGI